jgi:Tfp pilus assembly protein PilP
MIFKSIIIILLCSQCLTTKAQTFAEWFSQKKTQKMYLLQQIAALQIYSTYLKQGYGIATNGLGSISGYLKSENGLHQTYYTRLRTADPVVKNDPMVKEIMAWQQDILKRTQEINQVNGLTTAEKNYLSSVTTTVLKDCNQQLSSLQNVVSDNKAEMSDAERITLITRIHTAMQSNYQFTSSFAAQVKIVAVRRQQEENQAAVSKKVYGIN